MLLPVAPQNMSNARTIPSHPRAGPFANCENSHCVTMATFASMKLPNPLIAKACHSSLGSASLLASEGFLVVPALLRCLFEFFCDGRIHLR